MIHQLTALGPFTIADWCALPDREDGSRLELIKGNWLVTAPATGQHQWAESELITLLKTSLRTAERTDLYALGGVGVEVSTEYRTVLIPDFAVLSTPPLNTTFGPNDLLPAGEIWSPGNSNREQRDKHDFYAHAGIPFFWNVAQDRGGPVELAAYRLDNGRYVPETTAKAGDGPVTITAARCPSMWTWRRCGPD